MRGIIVKSLDYKEKSKIVYIYSILGLKGYKVLGVKGKKNVSSGSLITGNIIDFTFIDSSFPTLQEFYTIKSNLNCSNDLKTIEVLRAMIEILNYLPEDSNNELMYPFIEEAFLKILELDSLKVLSIFLIKMLYPFGVNPELKKCQRCGNTNDLIGFSITDHGALCKNCYKYNDNYLDYWQEYYYKKLPIEKYSDCDFIKLLKEIEKYYLINAHINLKLHL